MATRTFFCTKEQSLLNGTSPNSGSGEDDHAPIGENSSGQRFKELMRFPHDWSGMDAVQKVELYIRLTGGVHIGSSNWANGWLRISTLNGSFSEGGGGENYWYTGAATIWGGPGTRGLTDKWFGNKSNPNTWHVADITDLYQQVIPTRLGGLGKDNYGIVVQSDQDTNPILEFFSYRNSSYKPYLKVTYTVDVDPTIDFAFPEAEDL